MTHSPALLLGGQPSFRVNHVRRLTIRTRLSRELPHLFRLAIIEPALDLDLLGLADQPVGRQGVPFIDQLRRARQQVVRPVPASLFRSAVLLPGQFLLAAFLDLFDQLFRAGSEFLPADHRFLTFAGQLLGLGELPRVEFLPRVGQQLLGGLFAFLIGSARDRRPLRL